MGDDSLADRIASGIKASLLASVVNTVANAVLVIGLTRYLLEPAEFGLLNFALSTLVVATIFATLGFPKSAARYVTEFEENDLGQVPHVLRYSFGVVAGLVVVVGVVLVVFRGPLSRLLQEPSLEPFLLAGVAYVAFRASTNYLVAVFQGFNRVTYSALLRAISNGTRLVAAVTLVVLGHGAFGAFVGYIVGFAAATAYGALVLYRSFYSPIEAARETATGLKRRIVEYSIPLTATRGANVLDKKVDVILVGILANMTAVGYYSLAKLVSDFTSMPAVSLGFTISPALGKQKAGENIDEAANLYTQSLTYTLLLYIPACVGLVLVARPMILHVFGSEYAGAVPVVQVFSGFILVNAVNKVTSDGLDYLGRARSRAIVKSTMAVSNAGLNVLLIPVYGAVGAAAATVITYTVYTSTNVYVLHSELGLPVGTLAKRAAVVCVIAVAMGVAVYLVLPFVSGLVTLFSVVAFGGAVWAALGVTSGLLDVAQVRRMLG